MTTKIPPAQTEFLNNWGNHLDISENEKWIHMPFYFKKVGENMFEIVQFEKLPPHVIAFIEEMRGE